MQNAGEQHLVTVDDKEWKVIDRLHNDLRDVIMSSVERMPFDMMKNGDLLTIGLALFIHELMKDTMGAAQKADFLDLVARFDERAGKTEAVMAHV